MIVYKVVTSKRRSILSVLPIYLTEEEIAEFVYTYTKGSVIKAKEGTQGIVVFLRRMDAEKWDFPPPNRLILRCETVGKGRRVFHNADFNALPEALHHLKSGMSVNWEQYDTWARGPVGCYPAVKVLD